jgi:1-acyl-sn-glycerol-3-phosphate acyltransferase
MTWLRSALYTGLFFLTVVPYATGAIASGLFSASGPFRCARGWGGMNLWLAKVICGIDYEVEGLENVPETNGILYVKHQSVYEIFIGAKIFPAQCWVLKRELMWIPLFGWGLHFLRPIAIDRNSGGRAVRQVVRQGKERLAEGLWGVIYPEGTRVAPGRTRRYGMSGAALARESGYQVVPVAHNAGQLWPRRSWLKTPGRVKVVIGAPIDPAGLSAEEINRTAQEWIETTMRRISPEAYAAADAVSEKTFSQT